MLAISESILDTHTKVDSLQRRTIVSLETEALCISRAMQVRNVLSALQRRHSLSSA